jgi:hypothetical protein
MQAGLASPGQEPVMRHLYSAFAFFFQFFFAAVDEGPHIDPLGGATPDNGPVIDPWGRG